MDRIDTMTALREKQNTGTKWTGVDVRNTKVTDMLKEDVLEPVIVKEQIIKSATEAASMLLRIDDVIAASRSKMPAGPQVLEISSIKSLQSTLQWREFWKDTGES